jgi:hypothetical protein
LPLNESCCIPRDAAWWTIRPLQTEVESGEEIQRDYRTRNDGGFTSTTQRFGTDVRDGWATKVDFSGDIHKVWINETKECIVKRLLFRLGVS